MFITKTGENDYSLGQKLVQLVVQLGYLNRKFTSPKKESLVQILKKLLGKFKL
jgi:hypothetical protein